MTVTAVQYGTNADVIAVAQAMYPMTGPVLDLTPGTKRGFWTVVVPPDPTLLAPGSDFRSTGLPAATFAHICLDPPYVAPGGRKTSTIHEMNDRFGMLDTERTPMLQWERQILPAIVEARRLAAPRALLWFKCMDYVSSGRNHWFTKMAFDALAESGWRLEDRVVLAGTPGPQPPHPRQVHFRNAHSELLIARAVKAPR